MSSSPDEFLTRPEGAPADDPWATRPREPETGHPALATPPVGDADATVPGRQAFGPAEFGHFLILDRVAQGGMGMVDKAQELVRDSVTGATKKGRLVAIKRILRERMMSPEAVARFQRETDSAKKLDHPNIVPVYESGVISGEHYFTMPFVGGGSLQQHVSSDSKKRLSVRQAARLMQSVAEAAQYAHDHAVIHRDIKPQNILLAPNGSLADMPEGESWLGVTARLTDFGLARIVTEESTLSLSQKGDAMGTPGFMPPEQAVGDKDAIDARSDVYSLGATLYAVLTGRPPFPLGDAPQVSVLEILSQVKEADAVPPRFLNPEVPAELEDICLKCLEKEQSRRYQSARQLAEALDDVLAGRPRVRHTERRSGWLARLRHRAFRAVRKYPLRTAYAVGSVLAVAILAATLALVVAKVRSERDERVKGDQEKERREAVELLSLAETKARRGREEEADHKREAARSAYLAAADKYEELFKKSASHADSAKHRLAYNDALVRRGRLLVQDEKWDDAARAYLTAETDLGRLQAGGTEEVQRRRALAEAYHGMGNLLRSRRGRANLEKSLAYYHKALPIRKQLHAEQPDDLRLRRDLARNYGFMGDTLIALDRRAETEAAFREAMRLRSEVVQLAKPGPPDIYLEAASQHARDFENMAGYHARTGDAAAALKWYVDRLNYYDSHPAFRKVELLPEEFVTDRPNAFLSAAELMADLDAGRSKEALSWLDRAEREYKKIRDEAEDSAEVRLGLANVALVRGKALAASDPKEAERLFRDARRDLRALPEHRRGSADVLFRLAQAYAWLGQLGPPGAAAEMYDEALDRLRRAADKGHNDAEQIQRERGFASFREAGPHKAAFDDIVRRVRGGV